MADTTISSLNTIKALSANSFIPISNGTNTTKLGTESLFGFRNRVINGDMRIDQRNVGQITTWTPTSDYQFCVDRFRMATILGGASWGTGVLTGQQVDDAPAGFYKSLKLTVTTSDVSPLANSVYCLIHPIESNNVNDLKYGYNNASPVTISFWIKSSLSGIFSIGYRAQTESGDQQDYHYITEYVVNNINTWEYKTVTIPGFTLSKIRNFNNQEGVAVFFDLGCGSNLIAATKNTWIDQRCCKAAGSLSLISTQGATFYITGLQLEAGSTATPFECRPIGTELALCQRYFQKTYKQDVKPGTASAYLNAVSHIYGAGSYQNIWWRLPVTMRDTPTPTAYNPNTGTIGEVYNSSNATNYSIVFNNQYPYTSDSLVVGRTSIGQTVQNEINVHFTAYAEI